MGSGAVNNDKRKLTAEEKEKLIIKEIKDSQVVYASKYEGSFFGEIFGLSFKVK